MTTYAFLVKNDTLEDISYRTDYPEEVIHPRTVFKDGILCVYCQKEHVPLDDFIRRLAANESGLWVTGYRANGRQSTITFSKRERLIISSRLRKLLEEIQSAPVLDAPISDSVEERTSSATGPEKSGDISLTLEELQKRLVRQAAIGELGEQAAMRHEHLRLYDRLCPNPTAYITQVSKSDVGASFDIKSEFQEEVRFIEVKSSTSRENSFFISENERETLKKLGDDAYIYLVMVDESNPTQSRVIKELRNPFGDDLRLALQPTAYLAKLEDESADA
ncbi:DUF3883 domain-containing protein [Zoogloea sp.]|uniref:DUF3883 domain-containing protein n=1 Tax=Zoogloea sp. TaxID=49181 RepID=UPI0035AE79C3